jgi:hypothetical protein
MKLLIPFITHEKLTQIFREDISEDLNTPHIREHGHKIEGMDKKVVKIQRTGR